MVRGKNRNLPLTVMFLAALLFAGAARAQGTEEKGNLGAFKNHLSKQGFVWQDGEVWFPSILDMCCTCQLPSCYSNNRSSRYGFFALPPSPSQDPALKNPYAEWFTESQNLPANWSFAWRLESDEAVVFIGKTPPKVEYFGFTAYLYDRYVAGMGAMSDCTYVDDQGQPQRRVQPPSVQSRYPVFASLGDTLSSRRPSEAQARVPAAEGGKGPRDLPPRHQGAKLGGDRGVRWIPKSARGRPLVAAPWASRRTAMVQRSPERRGHRANEPSASGAGSHQRPLAPHPAGPYI